MIPRSSLVLLLPLFALASCKSEAPPPTAEESARATLLKNVRGAAAGAEYRRVLAEAPGATELAQQDLKDAEDRLAQLERRAVQQGLLDKDIDPEVEAGTQTGAETGRKALEDREKRKKDEEEAAGQ